MINLALKKTSMMLPVFPGLVNADYFVLDWKTARKLDNLFKNN